MRYVTNDDLVSRTHFARFLIETGHAKDGKDVFDRYLTTGKPGHVAHEWATLSQAIGWIHAAGGQAVIAHPGRYRVTPAGMRKLLSEFRDAGGDAIEILSPSHTPAQYQEFATHARVLGLRGSCGSDWHGPGRRLDGLGRPARIPRRAWCRCGRIGRLARAARRPDDHGMPIRRTVFFVSDRTGITAEMLGNSLLSQFEEIEFVRLTIPFVDSPDKAASVIEQINETAAREEQRAIVFSSIVDDAMSETIRRSTNALSLDLFQVFIAPLETELGAKSSHAAGRSHGIANSHEYFARMDAINFAQAHDDGAAIRELARAQVILVGVSRCGKTPTSLYLAMQFGIRAANFPLTPDDFVGPRAAALAAAAQGAPVRAHDQSGALAQDPRGAATGQPVLGARELPLRSARMRTPDGARANTHARYDGQVDRGDRDDDSLSR